MGIAGDQSGGIIFEVSPGTSRLCQATCSSGMRRLAGIMGCRAALSLLSSPIASEGTTASPSQLRLTMISSSKRTGEHGRPLGLEILPMIMSSPTPGVSFSGTGGLGRHLRATSSHLMRIPPVQPLKCRSSSMMMAELSPLASITSIRLLMIIQ